MPTRKKKRSTIVGVFDSKTRAEQAVAQLRRAGFDDDTIGMVYRDSEGKTVRTGAADHTYADEGAVAGAVAGAGAGALVGAGVVAGVIPVIGPVLAIGALGTILLNAAGGAAIAGIAGALIGWGIPEEDAEYYEGAVGAGKYLVAVEADGRSDEARAILHRYHGFDRHGWSAVEAYKMNPDAYPATTATTTGRTNGSGRAEAEAGRTVEVKEEQLRPRKTEQKAGEVEVRKEVHTEHQTVTVPVEREEVVIERRPVGRVAAGDIKAEEIRIPVKEEKVNVEKETVVKEEVSVGKRKVTDHQTVGGDVRKEEVVVETEGDARVRGDADKRRRK